MGTHQQEKTREKAVGTRHEEGRLKVEGIGKELRQAAAKQVQQPSTAPASPPSASSSPSHEFSFTISLHSSSTSIPDHHNKAKSTPPSFAIDLSPADDIFFHGHLLPLQLLSHLPVSPRSSTNSLDSFTLPIKDLSDDDQRPTKESSNNANNCSTSIGRNKNIINNKNNSCSSINQRSPHHSNKSEARGRTKSKSFSLFGLPKWRKDCEDREKEDKEMKHKRKMRFDVSHILKRYVRMVRPLLLFRGRKEKGQFRRQPYSFSGNLSLRNKHELRGRRGELSAPASMRTSPTNSGLLVATSATNLPSSTIDSTMEELQAAIQAAIAHCKNSIASATEEKIKC
ncbi:unnamed protein product [Prunus armeniaca]|uniref:BRI1 kinase inhibitor 1 n=1 Tax=Prunus armeniaca TaxID=36596 RepID=A0A6J5W929_PRUAR|nr:unnamed protein product [Prunus armeniaca]